MKPSVNGPLGREKVKKEQEDTHAKQYMMSNMRNDVLAMNNFHL